MTFLSILLAILIERFFADVDRYRNPRSYLDMLAWFRDRVGTSAFLEGWPGAILMLVPGMLVVGVMIDILDAEGFWLGLFSIAFSVAVLVWCMSAQPAVKATESFLERYDLGDEAGARSAAEALTGGDMAEDGRHWPGAMMTALFAQSSRRLFGPLFWFAVLGPVGAIAFRTADLLRERYSDGEEGPLADGIEMVYTALAWFPARLKVLAFALVGAFEETLQGWRSADVRCRSRCSTEDEALSVCAGYGALGLEPDWMHREDDPPLDTRSLRAAFGLVQRSLIVWVAVLGVLTLVIGVS